MKDQHGKPIPDDLVLLDNSEMFSDDPALAEKVMRLPWYESGSVIMVSYRVLAGAGVDWLEADPKDAGVDVTKDEIDLVAVPLHRYSPEDGFYHS